MYKLLLADDHQIVLDGLKSMLEENENFKVVAAVNNGKEALQILENLAIDMAILDIDMPVMNGIEALKIIQEKKVNTKVLMLSMHNEEALVAEVKRLKADGYLIKNSGKEVLNPCIYAILKEKKFSKT